MHTEEWKGKEGLLLLGAAPGVSFVAENQGKEEKMKTQVKEAKLISMIQSGEWGGEG